MAESVNLRPQILDLELYSGDGFSFKLLCKDKAGAPIDMRGSMESEIRVDRLHPEDPPLARFSINMTDAYQGIIVLSLTGTQTETLSNDPSSKSGTFHGVWDLKWVPSGLEPRTICQGTVECVPDVTS